MKPLFSDKKLKIVLQRMAHEIIERHPDLNNTALIGIQPRGVFFANRIVSIIQSMLPNQKITYGTLDITFYRDDYQDRSTIQVPEQTSIDFSIEKKKIILIDDVLYTGRTIRSALEALVDYGRPELVELMVLIDRRFSRELPIQPDYYGLHVDSVASQKVKVLWEERDGKDEIIMI